MEKRRGAKRRGRAEGRGSEEDSERERKNRTIKEGQVERRRAKGMGACKGGGEHTHTCRYLEQVHQTRVTLSRGFLLPGSRPESEGGPG